MLIRDAKTGNILTKPAEGPENHNWLLRRKSGLGRASKNEWEVISVCGHVNLLNILCDTSIQASQAYEGS